MRISDKISKKEILSWNKGDTITITAGTGAGKSYFIKNKLYEVAKQNNQKILMLVHRINCLDQFQYEIQRDDKEDIITLATYQSIENSKLKKYENNKINVANFDYIISDEFHYFFSDASFNKTTDLSFNTIVKANNSIKIFMSATGDYVERYLKNYLDIDTKKYKLEINFDFIKTLKFYRKDDTLDYFIKKAIEGNYKAIFFIESSKKAFEFYSKYKEHAMFNCSKSNELYHHVNEDKIKNLLENERFEDLILFTTTALDAGVNIIDKELNNIVCDVYDVRTLTQCIGRKRLTNEDDYIHLVVKDNNNNQIGGRLSRLKENIKMADYLRDHDTKSFINKFPRQYDKTRIIYDDFKKDNVIKKVNELAYFKCKIDKTDIKLMLDKGKFGYVEFIKEWFQKENYFIQEEIDKMQSLEDYLELNTGKRLLKDEKEELINQFDLRDLNNRQQKGIKTLNGYLEDNKLNYLIVSKKSTKTIKGIKKQYTYWLVLNNVNHK